MKTLASNAAIAAAAAPERYAARRNPDAPPERAWGVYDTQAARFVDRQQHPTWAGAMQAAGEHNRAYAAAMRQGDGR